MRTVQLDSNSLAKVKFYLAELYGKIQPGKPVGSSMEYIDLLDKIWLELFGVDRNGRRKNQR